MDNDKKMFEGNWECSKCHGAITQLPFQPDPSRTGGLTCRECFKKGSGGGNSQKQMHQGNWTCAKCQGAITQLPFEPRDTGNLTCLDCFRKQ
ncbi:hypothetical protein MNBD_BACTEROID05-23 [hydrothermal vent metagenome]|uniref:CxxC-x17-CxxC domain-containing protein n=1 Tax=hydrothermal vent metagenome TaxID=652676 RepID=A0A3B0TAW9_9ZZZZ